MFGNSQPEVLPPISELHRYLEEKVELPPVDPIEWWHTYESSFPSLSLMARDYLAIPATSVPLERCFSIAGNILTKQRGGMTEGIANAIMSCKYWLGFDEIIQHDMIVEGTLAEDELEGIFSSIWKKTIDRDYVYNVSKSRNGRLSIYIFVPKSRDHPHYPRDHP